MSTNTSQPCQFLSLPRELRNIIYSLALSPSSSGVHILYHPYYGRAGSFSVNTSILRVNRQVHDEAKPYLYCESSAVFRIDLSTHITPLGIGIASQSLTHSQSYTEFAPDLFRIDPSTIKPKALLKDTGQVQRSPSPGATMESEKNLKALGMITRRAFRLLRHLEMVVPTQMLWRRANKYDTGRASEAGWMLIRILETLKTPHKSSICPEKTLTIFVRAYYDETHQAPSQMTEEVLHDTRIIQLLQEVQQNSRHVWIEKINNDQTKELKDGAGHQEKKISAEDLFGLEILAK
ncbi:hypothetical protein MMC13_000550 [Lambiella insularis]|nr:hypothetical protein [Lambiella insularis]